MSQEKQNENVVSTGLNEKSIGLSGSAPVKVGGTTPSTVNSAADIPDWKKIGWKRVSELGEFKPDKKFQYDEILKELYYNDLWLHSAVVFVSLFSTWFIVLCGGGLGWIFILCAFIATYLKNSVTRFYRNAKSDISRKVAREKLRENDEKVEWLNEFMRRFWLIYEPILSASVIQVADTVLSASTPGFLDSIKLTNFTLGTKPPAIESIRSYPNEADDEVIMDWRVNFVPNDLAEMTKAQLVKKVNPKIILTVRIGRGIVGAGMPILLENMSLTGLLRVKLKLIPDFPHVKTIDACFLEEPGIDYVLKPIGGETLGLDIGIIPGLSSFIREQVHRTLKPMMYYPNSYTLETEYLLNGFPVESSIGILKLVLKGGRSLRNAETFGTSDPYCKVVLLSASNLTAVAKELTRTKYIDNSLNPDWNETHYLLLNNLNDSLKFQIYDYNGTISSDTLLGDNTFSLESLIKTPNQPNSTLPVMHNGKQKGELHFDAIWCPITKDDEPALESNVGILKFNIHQAKDLDPRLSVVGLYNPYVDLYYNGKKVYKSKVYRRSNDPTWEEFFEIFMTDRKGATLELHIRDERDFSEDPIVGSWSMSVDEFLKINRESKTEWFDLKKAKKGKVRLSCQWKPVKLDQLDHNTESSGYVGPLGIVKLHIKKATNIKNVAQLRGKSDPYIRIRLNSIYRGRTNMRNDNLNPIWDEYFYIPVHTLEEKIFLHCFDHENHGKDRNLGFTELTVKDLIKKSDDEKDSSAESIDTAAPLKDTKGLLFYSASFHPKLIDKEEIKEEKNKEDNISVLEHQSGILVININRANFKKKNTYVEVFVNNDTFPVYNTPVSNENEPHWGNDTDVFIKELNSSKIIFDIKQANSKSIGKVEFNVKKLLEKCLKNGENIWLPIEGMNNFALNIGLNYIPVKYNAESDKNENIQNIQNVEEMEHPHQEALNKKGHAVSAITNGVSKVGSHLHLLKKKDKDGNNECKKEEMTEEEEVIPDKSNDDEIVSKPEKTKPINVKQEKDKEELIPQENHVENHVKLTQEEKQKQLEEANGINVKQGENREIPQENHVENHMKLSREEKQKQLGATNGINVKQKENRELIPQEKSAENHVEVPREEKPKQLEAANGIKPYNVDFDKENKVSTTRHIEFRESPIIKRERKQDEGSRSSEENGVNNRLSAYSINQAGEIVGEPGTLKITVVEARNLNAASNGGKTSNSYVKVKANGKKEVLKTSVIKKSTSPKWNEQVSLKITGSPTSFLFSVRDRNLLLKDVELGDHSLNLWDHINKFDEYTKDIWVPLSKGTNSQLHVKLDFVPSSAQNGNSEKVSETNGSNGIKRTLSSTGKSSGENVKETNGNSITSKFSMRRKK